MTVVPPTDSRVPEDQQAAVCTNPRVSLFRVHYWEEASRRPAGRLLGSDCPADLPLPSWVLQESRDQPMRTTWGSGSVDGRCLTEISSLIWGERTGGLGAVPAGCRPWGHTEQRPWQTATALVAGKERVGSSGKPPPLCPPQGREMQGCRVFPTVSFQL